MRKHYPAKQPEEPPPPRWPLLPAATATQSLGTGTVMRIPRRSATTTVPDDSGRASALSSLYPEETYGDWSSSSSTSRKPNCFPSLSAGRSASSLLPQQQPQLPTTSASASAKQHLKHVQPPAAMATAQLLQEPPAKKPTLARSPRESPAKKPTLALGLPIRPVGTALATDGGTGSSKATASKSFVFNISALRRATPAAGAPAAAGSTEAVVEAAAVAGSGSVGDDRSSEGPTAVDSGTVSEARASSAGLIDARSGDTGVGAVGVCGDGGIVGCSGGEGPSSNGSSCDGPGSSGSAANIFSQLTIKKEPEAPCSNVVAAEGRASNLPGKVTDIVIISSDDEDHASKHVVEDEDADLLEPVMLGTSEPSIEDASGATGLKEGEFWRNGRVDSLPKIFTIDGLIEQIKEREKARLECQAAEERQKCGGFQELVNREEEKDRMLASSLAEDDDDDNILSEEQRALTRQMSVQASVIKKRHPGHRFCDAQLQQRLFSLTNCHKVFGPESSEGENKTAASGSDSTPLGLNPRGVEITLARGQLWLLLKVARNKATALDYAFGMMSCHSDSNVVRGIMESMKEILERPRRRANYDIAGNWYPSARLILGALMNFGLDLITIFSTDESLAQSLKTCRDVTSAFLRKTCDSCSQSAEASSRDVGHEPNWPTVHNFKAVLVVANKAARTGPVYADNDIETMILAAVLFALDIHVTEWDILYEMVTFIGAMLRALSKDTWQEKANNIVRKLATLLSSCHHHDRLRAVTFFTFKEADMIPYTRSRLAYAFLQQLLFDATEYDDIDDLKVKMLINVEESIILPTRGHEVDLYLTTNLLHLLLHSVNMYALDKAEQADLHKINTSLKERERKIRFSLQNPDVLELKNQIVLFTSYWTAELPSFENQQSLFYDRPETDVPQLTLAVERVHTFEEAEDASSDSLPSVADVDDSDE